jgi:ankyrin repeat protein
MRIQAREGLDADDDTDPVQAPDSGGGRVGIRVSRHQCARAPRAVQGTWDDEFRFRAFAMSYTRFTNIFSRHFASSGTSQAPGGGEEPTRPSADPAKGHSLKAMAKKVKGGAMTVRSKLPSLGFGGARAPSTRASGSKGGDVVVNVAAASATTGSTASGRPMNVAPSTSGPPSSGKAETLKALSSQEAESKKGVFKSSPVKQTSDLSIREPVTDLSVARVPELSMSSLGEAFNEYRALCGRRGGVPCCRVDDVATQLQSCTMYTLKRGVPGMGTDAVFTKRPDGTVRFSEGARPGDLDAYFRGQSFAKRDWPSLEHVCDRLGVEPGDLAVPVNDGLRASLTYLAGRIENGTYADWPDKPSLESSVGAALAMATLEGKAAVRAVLEAGLMDVNATCASGQTLLEETVDMHEPERRPGATFSPAHERVAMLLDCGAKADQPFSDGLPPSYHARSREVFAALVGGQGEQTPENVEIEGGSDRGTLLHVSANAEMVKAHRLMGLNVEARSRASGRTPLHSAIRDGRWEAARALISAGAKIDAVDIGRQTVLHMGPPLENGCPAGPPGPVVKFLLDSGAAADAMTSLEETPLFAARDAEAVRLLVPLSGTDWARRKSKLGFDVLHGAAQRGQVEVVRELRRLDTANELQRDEALMVAEDPKVMAELFPPADVLFNNAEEGHAFVVRLCDAAGANGWSADAYYLAVQHGGDPHLAWAAVIDGGSPDLKSLWKMDGLNPETPLDSAVAVPGAGLSHMAGLLLLRFPKDFEILRDHLDRGTLDVNVKDAQGRSLVWLAAEGNRSLDVVREFVERGADIHQVDKDDLATPLHRAAAKGNAAVVEYLIGQGASTERLDRHGKRPLDYAPEELRKAMLS